MLTAEQPLRIAVRDSSIIPHWEDYNSEAHLTRRLNDRGCPNVINVRIFRRRCCGKQKSPDNCDRSSGQSSPATEQRNSDGTIRFQEHRHRTCYEYADYGDLFCLESWYETHR